MMTKMKRIKNGYIKLRNKYKMGGNARNSNLLFEYLRAILTTKFIYILLLPCVSATTETIKTSTIAMAVVSTMSIATSLLASEFIVEEIELDPELQNYNQDSIPLDRIDQPEDHATPMHQEPSAEEDDQCIPTPDYYEVRIEHENIQSFSAHKEAIQMRLSQSDSPDFLCLTETSDTARGKNKTFISTWIKNNCKDYCVALDNKTSSQEKNRGTAVIMKKCWEPLVQEVIPVSGCMTAVHIKHKELEFLVASIYVPTGGSSSSKNQKERVAVYNKVDKVIEKFENIQLVLMGDYNGRVSLERDHFPSSDSKYRQQDGDTRLQRLLNRSPIYDSFRRLHPDTVAYTHETTTSAGPTKSRIDYALLNDHAMNNCTSSYIYENPLDIGLHHKTIGVTIRYSATWKFQKKNQRNETKAPKINYKKLTKENAERFKTLVDEDKEVCLLRKKLEDHKNNPLPKRDLQRLVTSFYTIIAKIIRRSAKTALPIKNNYQKSITEKTKKSRLDKSHKDLNLASALCQMIRFKN
jgi:exonuclease III